MKKAVVYMLTAIVVSSACITPMVAFATDEDTAVVSETDNEKSDETTDKKTEDTNSSDEGKDTSKKEESSSDKDSKKEDTSKDNKTSNDNKTSHTKKESSSKDTSKKELEKLSLSDNVSALKPYIGGTDKLGSFNYIPKKDVIIMGYNYSGDSEKDGFLYPNYTVVDKVTHAAYAEIVESDEDIHTPSKIKWNQIEGVYTLDELTSYVKKNIDKLVLKAKNPVSDHMISMSMFMMNPQSYVVFNGTTGDYIGRFQQDSKDDSEEIYDESVLQLTGDANINVSYNDDKSQANLTFDFNVSYPETMGGAVFKHFDIYDSKDMSKAIFTSTQSVPYVSEVIGKAKGTVKNVPLTQGGNLVLRLNTTQGSLDFAFAVEELNEPTDESKGVAPNITFSKLDSNILDGTPTTITMYSDVEATLVFNGEASPSGVKEYSFTVRHNGDYNYSAVATDGGKETSGTHHIDSFVDEGAYNLGNYNTGGTTFLPQTGGMSTLAIVLSGIFMMVGGIVIAKKDALLTMIHNHGRKV